MADRHYNQTIISPNESKKNSNSRKRTHLNSLPMLAQVDRLPKDYYNTATRNSSQCYNQSNSAMIPEKIESSMATNNVDCNGNKIEKQPSFNIKRGGNKFAKRPSWLALGSRLNPETSNTLAGFKKREVRHDAKQPLSLFPMKLHQVLDDAETKGFQHIISWHCEGKAFKVHDWKQFEQLLMPIYFASQKKYKSFQRQLNLYEFERLNMVQEKGFYQHRYFVKGGRTLCLKMKVRKIKGKSQYLGENVPKGATNWKTGNLASTKKATPFDRSNSDGQLVKRRKITSRKKNFQEEDEVDIFEGRFFYAVPGLDKDLMKF